MPEVLVHVIEAKNLPFVNDGDVYPVIRVQKEKTKGKKVKLSSTVWNQFYLVSFKSSNPLAESVFIELNTHKTFGKDTSIGECRIPLETVYQGVESQTWYPIMRVGAQVGEIKVGLSGVDFGGIKSNTDYADEAPIEMDYRNVPQGVPPPMMHFEDGQAGPYYHSNVNEFPSMQSPTTGPSMGSYYAPPPGYFGAAPPSGAAPTASPNKNGTPAQGYPYAQQFQTPNGQTVFIVTPPPAAAGPQRAYFVQEPLTPEQIKKLRRRRRWRTALRVTGIVLLGLLTVATFILIGTAF